MKSKEATFLKIIGKLRILFEASFIKPIVYVMHMIGYQSEVISGQLTVDIQ